MEFTYEDYCALFPGRLSQEEFSAGLPEAAARLSRLTAGRADSAEAWTYPRQRMALCAALHMGRERGRATGVAGVALMELRGDGYAERYADPMTEAQIDARVLCELSGTGLCGAL